MAMTEREFLTKVLAIEGITDEVKGYATEGIAKLDARNDKRKNTQTKAQKENVETMKSIVATITANGAMFASDIGVALGWHPLGCRCEGQEQGCGQAVFPCNAHGRGTLCRGRGNRSRKLTNREGRNPLTPYHGFRRDTSKLNY